MTKTNEEQAPARYQEPALRAPRAGLESSYTLIYLLLKIALGGIFIYAGFVKILEPRAFAHALDQYGLVPEALLPVVAIGLPVLEVLAGIGLIFEVRGSLTTVFFLLVIFLAVLGYAIAMDLDIDCGCFTWEELNAKDGVKTAFWRDLAMIAGTLFLFWRRRVWLHTSRWREKLLLTTNNKGGR